MIVNQIRDSRSTPFVGDRAVSYALAGLKSLRVQESVGKKMEILEKGSASKIQYNEAYKPKPAPKAAAGKSAAPASKPGAPAPATSTAAPNT